MRSRIQSAAGPIGLVLFAVGLYPLLMMTNREDLVAPVTLAAGVGLAAIGLDVSFGLANQLSLAQSAFFGMGAYGVVIAMTRSEAGVVVASVGVLLVVIAVSAVLGAILTRLAGFYFATGTLGVTLLVQNGVLGFPGLTNGTNGLVAPVFSVGSVRLVDPMLLYAVLWGVAVMAALIVRHLARSPWGVLARAVGADEQLVASLGARPVIVRVQAFVIGSCLAALGGVLSVAQTGFVSPADTDANLSLVAVLAVILGARRPGIGALLAAAALSVGPFLVPALEGQVDLLYAAVLILLMVVRLPQRWTLRFLRSATVQA